jgi:hypothetical protein
MGEVQFVFSGGGDLIPEESMRIGPRKVGREGEKEKVGEEGRVGEEARVGEVATEERTLALCGLGRETGSGTGFDCAVPPAIELMPRYKIR